MNLPTVQECESLFQQYHVPKNILGHCQTVSLLATRIAERLKAKGIKINIELVRIGALMHDWMKAATLEQLGTNKYFKYTPSKEEIASWKQLRTKFNGKHECEIAHELLKGTHPELAQFILSEGLLTRKMVKQRVWEEKVVHYADWRVLGTEIIPLDERMADFLVRYNQKIVAGGHELWQKKKQMEQQAEREICEALNCTPEEL